MISVKMFSGEILIFNQSCHYEFINNKLEVLFPNRKICNDASIGKTLEGNRFTTFNKTIFYKNDCFVSSVGYSEFSPNMLINYVIDKSCIIDYSFELNYLYRFSSLQSVEKKYI